MTEVIFIEVFESRMEMRACEIAERAYLQGDKLQVIAADTHQADRLDELLWTFRPDSFIPHGLAKGEKDEIAPPVVITSEEEKLPGYETLLMMEYCQARTLLKFAQAIHLIVVDNQKRLDASRDYWTKLKEAGFSLRHQKR